jgi:hypothetical protein
MVDQAQLCDIPLVTNTVDIESMVPRRITVAVTVDIESKLPREVERDVIDTSFLPTVWLSTSAFFGCLVGLVANSLGLHLAGGLV